jgi:predicted nucleic acid-binding protein
LRIGDELVILFCHTSALMKLLVDEAQSDQMRQISSTVDAIGVCRISWGETMAALSHLQREDPISNEDLEQARQHLIQSWNTFTIVEVSQPVMETAGRFADAFALRGYDSVQLAAAHELQINAEQTVLFACYDRRLNQAAQLLQLEGLA